MASKKPAPRKTAKAATKMAMKHRHEDGACCGMNCPLLEVMCTRMFWTASVITFIGIFIFDFFFHGQFLMDSYRATSAMWRPEADMNPVLCFVSHGLTAMVLSALVLLMNRASTWWGGFITGVLAGAPLAISSIMAYAALPFASPFIPAMWALGALVQGALAGLIITSLGCSGSCKTK